MAHKFTRKLIRKYCEISQPNPIRWEMLYLDDGVFKPQTGLIKCRDFFNDIVSKVMVGRDIAIYGLDTSTVKINEDGVWMRVSGLINPDLFIKNINTIVNTKMQDELGTNLVLEPLPRKKVLIFFPKVIFSSTYLTSLVTWLIRLSNFEEEFESYEQCLTKSSAKDIDRAIAYMGLTVALKWGFKLPEGLSSYWYYAGANYNSAVDPTPTYAGTIHNCGVMNWAQHAPKGV